MTNITRLLYFGLKRPIKTYLIKKNNSFRVSAENSIFNFYFLLYSNEFIRKVFTVFVLIIIYIIYVKYFSTPMLCQGPIYPICVENGWVYTQTRGWYWYPKDPYLWISSCEVVTPGRQINLDVSLPPMREVHDGTPGATVRTQIVHEGVLREVIKPKHPQPGKYWWPGSAQPRTMAIRLEEHYKKHI